LPQISLRPRDDPITVIAGESSQIDCMVADARPAPAIIWMLGIFFFKENKKIDKNKKIFLPGFLQLSFVK
jgi:hypothetical protein